jgi:hypothetical protein
VRPELSPGSAKNSVAPKERPDVGHERRDAEELYGEEIGGV